MATDSRPAVLHVRMHADEAARVRALARNHGITISEYVRRLLARQRLEERDDGAWGPTS